MAKTRIMIKLANGKYIDMSKAVKPEDKVHKVMREFKEGKLKSSSGQVVTSRDQAIAIAMSESGLSKNMIHDIAIEYDSMEKARPTKYIKRVPKPSGKGYYYFYTREQVKEFQEKGVVPKEEKKERKGIMGAWSALADFFGITGNRGSDETAFRSKINDEYSKHKDKLEGADISSFAQHLNEFLANKDKWIAKFSKEPGEKKPSGEKKEPGKKKEPAGEKKPGQKWNINLMKALVEIYGEKKEQQEGWKSGISNDFSKDYKKYAEGVLNDVKKNNNLAKSYLEDIQSDIRRSERMIKSIKKQAQGTGEDFTGAMSGFETRIKDASILSRKIKEITGEYPSPDNFDTMPEGMEKIKDEKDNELWTVKKDGFDYRINKTEKGWRVSGGEIGAIQEGNRPITIIGSKLANSPEEALSKHIQEIKDSKKKPSATEALKEELGKKESNRLKVLENSLEKKKNNFDEKLQNHFDTVKQANGQPLNDKRNGRATLNKWDRQNDSLRKLQDEIEKTKNAIEKEKNKIENVESAKEGLPKELLNSIESGDLIQWRKHPNTFFVKGVDKARIVYDPKKNELAYRYLGEIKDPEQRKLFAKTYNSLSNQINKKTQTKTESKSEPKKESGSSPEEKQAWDDFHKQAISEKNSEFSDQGELLDEKTGKVFEVYNKTMADLVIKKYKQQGVELEAKRDRTGNYSFKKKSETLKKALSSLREELLLKAQPTKYIKKIPNPKGNGYIYFYTQDQVKEYEKSGKLPEEQKKKPDSQSATGDKKQVLKDALKKVATIFADALSAKDVVQPSGSAVEQVGENISAKKRLDKKKDIKDNTGKNKPEEKPKK